jgi:hypothetical protein
METQSLLSLDGLAELGMRNGVDMRPTLLRMLTDLYVQKLAHTPDEERHYTELALRLIDSVDVPTRVAIASRLARHLSPPVKVVQRLAGDLPEVAGALRSHPLVQPSAAVEEVALHPAVMPVAEDTATVEADEADMFAAAPRAIDTTTAGELNELFSAANVDERRLILLNLEIVAPLVPNRIDVTRDPSVGQRLEAAALGRSREDFAQHLAHSLQIPREQARRIVDDNLGEPVVVAAKALGIARDVLYRILLFVNAAVGHSVERVHALAELYDEITPRAAEDMVAIWQALQSNERSRAKHQPLAWDDETRGRARPAPAAQRNLAVPRTGERRSAS